MSIIQRIREKGALISAIVIAISLLGFILMDAFAGRTGSMSDSVSSYVGKVNGKAIDRLEFDKKIKEMEFRYTSQGQPIDDNTRQQIMQQLWNDEVNDILLEEEYERLGLTVTDKELRGFLLANPPEEIKQGFKDEQGNFNATNAQNSFNNSRLKDPVQKEQIRKYFLLQKFTALFTNSIYIPQWFLEKRNADNALMGKFSYVKVDYATIADSTIKISDDEIRNYMKAHKSEFEQKEETRSVNFITFSAAPSRADSQAAYNSLATLKAGFEAATNNADFVQRNGSTFPFYDAYLSRNAIQNPNKDSFLSAPVGKVYEPYLDAGQTGANGVYALSKIIDMKQWPDTAKARHILVGTMQRDPQSGQMFPTRPDSVAKKLADSLMSLLAQGQNFDTLVSRFSDDQGSKTTGGVYDNLTANGQMVPQFTEFAFSKKVGERGIVKTDFGYHIMEVLSQKGSTPAYKIAYLTRDILTSPETDQDAHNQANQFSGDSRDLKSFNDNYDKNLRSKGLQKLVATDIRPMDFSVNGLQDNARSLVKKIFDADKGDVLEPERVGNNYVVAIVTEINEPGLASVSTVRPYIEPLLRNRKKGEQIVRNIGQFSTLEQVASKVNQPVLPADSVRFSGGGPFGYEPKVLGAVFNPANKGKVITEAIAGTSAVYALRVENQATVPVEAASIDEQRRSLEMREKQTWTSGMQQGYNPAIEIMKRNAKIKDNRAEFF